jgi:hypothetical protein
MVENAPFLPDGMRFFKYRMACVSSSELAPAPPQTARNREIIRAKSTSGFGLSSRSYMIDRNQWAAGVASMKAGQVSSPKNQSLNRIIETVIKNLNYREGDHLEHCSDWHGVCGACVRRLFF